MRICTFLFYNIWWVDLIISTHENHTQSTKVCMEISFTNHYVNERSFHWDFLVTCTTYLPNWEWEPWTRAINVSEPTLCDIYEGNRLLKLGRQNCSIQPTKWWGILVTSTGQWYTSFLRLNKSPSGGFAQQGSCANKVAAIENKGAIEESLFGVYSIVLHSTPKSLSTILLKIGLKWLF